MEQVLKLSLKVLLTILTTLNHLVMPSIFTGDRRIVMVGIGIVVNMALIMELSIKQQEAYLRTQIIHIK